MNAPIASLASPPSPRFEALYRDNYAFVWRCARRMCVEDGEVEDVIQDVFVIAYRRLDRLTPDVAPSTWLFGIMRNVVRNRARGHVRRSRRLGALARDIDMSERHRQRLETELAERVLAGEMLVDFLRELDEAQRAVFVLAELEGHTARQIADALDISPNTASSRLRLARRAFCLHFGIEPSRRGELTRPLREQPEQPEASVQNHSWGLLLVALAKPGAVAKAGALAWMSSKLMAVVGTGAVAVGVTVVAVQIEPSPRSPKDSSSVVSAGVAHPTSNERIAAAPIVEPTPEVAEPPVVVRAAPRAIREKAPAPAEQLPKARAALVAEDPRRALELLAAIDEHDDRLLGQRVATQVAALCKLGDAEAARRVLDRLREREPTSPMLEQLDGACW